MNKVTGISVILFDLDGTIADTNELILRTITETLERATGRLWRREELLPQWGYRLRDQLRILHPDIHLDDAVAFYRCRYAKLHDRLMAEFPGMRDLLDELIVSGYHLGVVTSKKRAGALQTLESLNYRHYFAEVIVEEDTTRHKPEPDPLLLALARFGVCASEAVYIGDNPDDIVAAHAAGMPAVAVGWCLRSRTELIAAGAELIIDHPSNLVSFISKRCIARP